MDICKTWFRKTVFAIFLCAAHSLFAADNRPIGVFDSGTGGLTVLEKMLTDDFAHERFVYLGDQANMPYGDYAAAGKSDFLRGLVISDAEFLLGKNAKIVVIACNTATAYGYDAVQQLLKKRGDGTRVIGVVNAGARSAIRQLDLVRNPRPCAIGVMATPGTIASGVYARTIRSELVKLGVTCEVQVFSRGCAGLADAVEAGSPAAPKIACKNLRALLEEHRAKAPHLPLRAVILGCTHFPFVQRELEGVVPEGVTFIDPAVDTAAECAAALKAQDRQTDARTPTAVETYVSVAAPGLDPSKLDEKGGLTRAWKYGRTDAATDRSTVPVPIREATKGDPLKFIPFAHMIPRVRRLLVQPPAETHTESIVADILADALTVAELAHCHVDGAMGAKFDRFMEERCFSDFARRTIFREARDAFAHPADDVFAAPTGVWRGEFWGKLMISAARVAAYSGDAAYKAFLREEAHRLIAYQRPDGYLGSYVNPDFVCAADPEQAKRATGWANDFCWNVWCRKYTLWGLLAAWRLTGDRELLTAADRAMTQQIEVLQRLGIKIWETGTTRMVGLPSCSVLKPLLWLYQDTGKKPYLDFAREIVASWDRPGNPAPSFFANVASGKPMHQWYPEGLGNWAKAYEMMSCLDGLLEYYRVTGEARVLRLVRDLQAILWTQERNLVESVGYNDQFVGAARLDNAASEPCDAIHWIRLNLDLYLITGDVAYVNALEYTLYNALLAGVYRDGRWGAREVRSVGRHVTPASQCGLQHQHCCVNNMPRSFMDIAQLGATQEADGTTRVNLYHSFTTDFTNVSVRVLGDYRFGDYPVSDRVTVEFVAAHAMRVKLRLPPWSKKTLFRRVPAGEDEVAPAGAAWQELSIPAGRTLIGLRFDMSPRLEIASREGVGDFEKYVIRRWNQMGADAPNYYLKKSAARLFRGPMLLAKSKNVGDGEREILSTRFSEAGWKVQLKPLVDRRVNGAWRAIFTRGGETVETNVCDFPSAGDADLPVGDAHFSIFF